VNARAPLVALALALVGVSVAVFYLVRAFGAVADVDPSMKATLLAQKRRRSRPGSCS
jgi:hypothetical protein